MNSLDVMMMLREAVWRATRHRLPGNPDPPIILLP